MKEWSTGFSAPAPGFEETLRTFIETLYEKGDIDGTYALVEPSLMHHYASRKEFERVAQSQAENFHVAWSDLVSVDYFADFGRGKFRRRPDGHPGCIYGVYRAGRWWIIFFFPLVSANYWLDFLKSYVGQKEIPASLSREERDKTRDLGRELAKTLEVMFAHWKHLIDEDAKSGGKSDWLLDMLRSRYPELRHAAYECLKKEYGVDFGIGDEFLDFGPRHPTLPEWYVKWRDYISTRPR